MAGFISTLFGNSTASPAKLFPEGAKGEHADMPTLPEKLKLPRDFSRVILTLENVLLPDDKITMTPSRLDGVTEEIEMDLRIYGSELIQTSGGLLDLPQVAMATGQVLFQRFYYCKSFVKHNVEVVAMACVHLASKIDEAPRRIRDVMSVFHHIKQIRLQKRISSLMIDTNYINLKNQVIKEERRVLKELGFCVHVKHAHKMIVMYLQVLEQEKNRRFLQCAWNYMNDSFRTNVFVRFPPETIACSCIYLAARQLQIVLPNNPPWFALFGATESEIKRICLTVLSLYTRSKPNPEELEKSLMEVRAVMKSKTSASAPTNSSTPHLISAPGTPLEQRQGSPATSTAPSGTNKRSGEVKSEANGRYENKNKSDYYHTDSRRHRSRSGSRGRREESRDDKYRNSRYDRRGDKGVKRSRSPVSYKSKQRDERDVKRSRTTIDLTNDDVYDHRDNQDHRDKSYKDHHDKSGSANSDRSGKDHRDKSHKDHDDVKSSKGHRDAEPVKSHRDKSSKDHRDKSSKDHRDESRDHRDVEKLSRDLRDASKNQRDGYREYRGGSRDREDAKLRAVQSSRDVSPVSKHSSNRKREKIELSRKSDDLYKKDRKDIDKYDLSSYKKESRSAYNGKKSSDNGSRLLAPSR